MLQKRYEYYTREGIKWTKWFNYEGTLEPYQFGKKLKNEYREI